MLMQGFGTVLWLINLAVLGLAVFALIDAAFRREDAFRATDKRTKPFWLILLGIAVAVNLLIPMIFLQVIFLIASIVYIVDVRPAVKEVSGPRSPRRGSSSDGPYGPFNGNR